MVVGVVKEYRDTRVALVPETVKKLKMDGAELMVEAGCGAASFYSDAEYAEAGAVVASRPEVLAQADLISTIDTLPHSDLEKLKPKATLISSYQPFVSVDHLSPVTQKEWTIITLDMIPRTTLAQSMDILSSMASIAGYKAVLTAANLMPKYFPMLTTAAGSIPPAKVLILGAGVAGLQAIATAKRLGAKIEAFDTRLAAKEEVESLGAKFVMVEGAKDERGAGGYAVEQSEEYKQKQRELIFDRVVKSDVVITTAQLRGKPAPRLVSKEMVAQMKAGSVIVDLAASSGGNCELTKDNETVVVNGVFIVGNSALPSGMPLHASQLYSRNVYNLMKTFLIQGQISIDMENEILKSACVVKDGQLLFGKN
ncbi:MAG: Re/Si-specific NAD(P)(+) transhydrogenase subunit alpha [Cytophagales bacterium]|nr:Re/Si-specific NAD(P)(+) transhydrogenase subunit alpha [Cytophagales bacterium]